MQTLSKENYVRFNTHQVSSEHDAFTEERYLQFYRFFPKNTHKVLDVGCNTGRGGKVLKNLDYSLHITGIDCVQDRLARLPEGVYSDVICSYSTEIFSEDNTFDTIVAGEFIEHLYPIDVDQSLSEFFRALKIGGRLLLTTPNPVDIKKRFRSESVLGTAHLSQHFPDALKLKLKMLGYANIKVLGSGKVTRYLGYHFPLLNIYGSYLVIADKK